ncbi:cation diffusion facilitator family transporter [Massilia sp. W12]|uniref:cation diffusion facilitator family transporter n=1 Tax=Massilia sp. W12 TaxID=3126507 RepID=UPI0030D0CAAD
MMGHAHSHDHGAHHHHHGDPLRQGRAFMWAIGLNSVFVVLEFVYGWLAHSTALMADAGHNLSDVLSLILAWGAARLAQRAPSARYTYGWRKSSILVALLNAMLLMFACGVIVWEALHRLWQPTPVEGGIVSLLAAIGIAVNGFSAWLFMAGAKHDLNLKGAYLHLAADAAISFGVLLTGLVLMVRDWYWLDPLVSLIIVAIVLWGTWSLLTEALQLVMAAVPMHIDPQAVQSWLRSRAGVTDVHDLHIWALSTTENALTAHLVMPGGHPGDTALEQIGAALKAEFGIMHCTLQVELGACAHSCSLLQPASCAHEHDHDHDHAQTGEHAAQDVQPQAKASLAYRKAHQHGPACRHDHGHKD